MPIPIKLQMECKDISHVTIFNSHIFIQLGILEELKETYLSCLLMNHINKVNNCTNRLENTKWCIQNNI